MDQRWDADHQDAHACRVSVYIMTTHLPGNDGEHEVIVHSLLSVMCILLLKGMDTQGEAHRTRDGVRAP